MGGANDPDTAVVVSAEQRSQIACGWLKHAPPGEFNEVFNSVRMLVSDDDLIRNNCAKALAEHNTEQFLPVLVRGGDGTQRTTLLTKYSDLGGGRFLEPNLKVTFKFDHFRKEVSDVQPATTNTDRDQESWRAALQREADAYVDAHFQGRGAALVIAPANDPQHVVLCLEAHIFQPKNFWNGRWRSEWTIPARPGPGAVAKGSVRVQVHYYEDGNVQLFSDKDMQAKVQISADYDPSAKEVLETISREEATYQTAVLEAYTSMSDVTFKALRRQLPVTRAKMDWQKLPSYRISHDLNKQ